MSKKKRNPMAKILRSSLFTQRVARDKTKYTRKRKHKSKSHEQE